MHDQHFININGLLACILNSQKLSLSILLFSTQHPKLSLKGERRAYRERARKVRKRTKQQERVKEKQAFPSKVVPLMFHHVTSHSLQLILWALEVPTGRSRGELEKQSWKMRHEPFSTHPSLFLPSKYGARPRRGERDEQAKVGLKLKALH